MGVSVEHFMEDIVEKRKDIHFTMPYPIARTVDRLAKARGCKRVEILRQALERYFAEIEREETEAALRQYVEKLAPHSREFVAETEAEVRRTLLRGTEW